MCMLPRLCTCALVLRYLRFLGGLVSLSVSTQPGYEYTVQYCSFETGPEGPELEG